MPLQLSEKERMLLEDQKNHEMLCIEKYAHYGKEAEDEQLQLLCEEHEAHEKKHLDTINKLLNGKIPKMNQQQSQNQQSKSKQSQSKKTQSKVNNSANDKNICSDLIMGEKFISGVYNTAIFEFRDTNVRQILNHIQTEEQKHGEELFQYMQSNGMYQVK